MPDVTIVLPTPPAPARASRTVVWTMDIDSDDRTDAAVQALEIQRDPASVATVFRVYEPDGSSVLIDVEDPDAPRVILATPAPVIRLGHPYRLTRAVPLLADAGELGAGAFVTPIREADMPRYRSGPMYVAIAAGDEGHAREVIVPAAALGALIEP